jgi:hypothetical protein
MSLGSSLSSLAASCVLAVGAVVVLVIG